MAKTPESRLRYQRAYNSTPKEKKKRAARNKARRIMIQKGKARKGDGKDVHHKDHNTQNSSARNLVLISKKKNRADNLRRGGRKKG